MGVVVERYDVVLVNLDPTIGREIKKIRPAIFVSPDELNRHWGVIIIVPLTSVLRNLDFRSPVFFGGKKGQAAVDQIRSTDKVRILKKLGRIKEEEARALFNVIQIMFEP